MHTEYFNISIVFEKGWRWCRRHWSEISSNQIRKTCMWVSKTHQFPSLISRKIHISLILHNNTHGFIPHIHKIKQIHFPLHRTLHTINNHFPEISIRIRIKTEHILICFYNNSLFQYRYIWWIFQMPKYQYGLVTLLSKQRIRVSELVFVWTDFGGDNFWNIDWGVGLVNEIGFNHGEVFRIELSVLEVVPDKIVA